MKKTLKDEEENVRQELVEQEERISESYLLNDLRQLQHEVPYLQVQSLEQELDEQVEQAEQAEVFVQAE